MKNNIYLFIILSIFLINSCNNTNNKEIINANNKNISTISEYGEDFELIANKLKSLINSEEEDVSYDCVNTESSIYFTIWKDGIAVQALQAKNGDKSSLEYWNKNVSNYQQTALELYNYALQLGLKSKPFRFAVLNEKNKNNILAIFENNKKIYDFVNN